MLVRVHTKGTLAHWCTSTATGKTSVAVRPAPTEPLKVNLLYGTGVSLLGIYPKGFRPTYHTGD